MTKLPIAAASFAAASVLLVSLAVEAGRQSGATDSAMPTLPALQANLPLPVLRLEWSVAQGLRLSGTVPDGWERDALLRQARSIYGPDRVTDDLATAAVANPTWLSPAFVPDLRTATVASAVLSDARLVIDGAAPNERARRLLAGNVAAFADYGLRVENRVVVR